MQAPAQVPVLTAAHEVPVPLGLSNLPMAEVFIGREVELFELASAMRAGTQVVAQAVSGLGGIGKSSLAAAYARTNGTAYTGIWWLVADSLAAAEAGLADLTRRLCPQVAGHPEPMVLVQWALSWLAQHPGMLLVWDNVEDVEDVQELIAALPQTAHLVTSRRSNGWHRIGVKAPLRLGPLPAADAMDLLTALTGPVLAGDDAATLCCELGYLPLAVEQVGAYLAEAGMTADQYLAAWRTGKAAPGWAPELSSSDRVMTGVWRATLDRLSDTPLAGQVLHVLAWLAPEGVPVAWLAEAFGDCDTVRESLRRLQAFSMVSVGAESLVRVHRVVQAVTRTPDLTDKHRQHQAIVAAQHTAVEILAGHLPKGGFLEPEVTRRWRILMPHIESFAVHAAGRMVVPSAIDVMDRAFGFWAAHGNLAAAISIAACSLAAEEQRHGGEHPDTLTSRNNLAGAYGAAGRVAEAIELFEIVLASRERVLGLEHTETLSSRNNLAGAYSSAGRVAEAIDLLEAALASRERVLGVEHPETLYTRNNLAGAYGAAGRVAEAIELYGSVVASRELVLGPNHPATLASRNNLAFVYWSAGRVAEAIVLFEDTFAELKRVMGSEHPATLASHNNLAGAYEAAGRVAEAIVLFEATFAARERVLGPEHPDTLASRNNLAGAYAAVGRAAEALESYEVVLTARERVLGPKHPDTLASRNNLAFAYGTAGRIGEATGLFEATLGDRERVLGPDHPETLTSRNNLASIYQLAGRIAEALVLYEAVLADRERVLGAEYPATLTSRNNLASAYKLAGRVAEAAALYEGTLAIRQRVLGLNHPDTLGSRNNLAYTYHSLGRVAEAVSLFEKTLADCEQILGRDHPTTQIVRENFIEIQAESWG